MPVESWVIAIWIQVFNDNCWIGLHPYSAPVTKLAALLIIPETTISLKFIIKILLKNSKKKKQKQKNYYCDVPIPNHTAGLRSELILPLWNKLGQVGWTPWGNNHI